jgi:hypothetical protein
MTNYNCNEKDKLIVTYEDIKCMMCKKKYLTQNLFEWHGCFMKTRGSCLKCGQYFQKKKSLLKHYVRCEGEFVTPEAARDPNRNVIKSEMVSPSSRGSVVKVTGGVRKKTVPQRRMTTIKAEKEINLGNVSQEQLAEDEEDDEYANYEEDITYDNFGSDDDDDDSAGPNLTNLEPVVQLEEQTPLPRIIDIKPEKSIERTAVNQSTIDGVDPQIIRSIKREQGSKLVVSTDVVQQQKQQQLAVRIKAERGANEQPVVQVLNPLAIGGSANTTTITVRKKVFKLPPELAAKIKQEKVSVGDDDMRDEAEPDSEEEAAMEAARITPPALIKEEKLDSAYGDDIRREREQQSNTTKQLINPMALAMMREKSATTNGSESMKNSLVISAVTSMSANPSTTTTTTNGDGETTAEKEEDDTTPQSAHEDNSTTTTTITTTVEGSGSNGNSVEVKESSSSSACAQVLNPVMVEIPAEFSSKASSEQQHFSPAVTEMSSTVSAVNNEVAMTSDVTSAEAMNTNEEDDELNLLLENLEKFGGESDIGVANNLQDSDLQDLLKFD